MFRFLKNSTVKGLLILLPILFLIIVIKELLGLLIALATPIADLVFPQEVIDSIPELNVLAMLLILASSLALGILALVPGIAYVGRYVEQYVLNKIPVYQPLKTLLHALLDWSQWRIPFTQCLSRNACST